MTDEVEGEDGGEGENLKVGGRGRWVNYDMSQGVLLPPPSSSPAETKICLQHEEGHEMNLAEIHPSELLEQIFVRSS